ncbi:hypothetical protein Pst134EB_024768 [Puccinia striiformis f. sp. tritici]|nr:hypothetical protein Pst134EB_024768 [Puccinia striiformis f. sp. tritici]
MDPRTINFNVLRRHDPQISSILDSTSYAVIYRYFHGAWSKTGFEGTLFIFQRDIHPFGGVFVLNRQGLDNLCEGLLSGWDVDLDEGLIIWRSAGATGDADDDVIYGIWVYEEKDRTRIATAMQELIENAASAEQKSPQPQQQPLQQPSSSHPPVSLSHPVPRVPIITAGQTISLDQLFGVGSVCSEPPPQTSALPHPGASVIDPDEEKENLLPSQVMSPDPSDLPKGMQLLDSLFQKAAIKSHGSHQSNSSNCEPTSQHPTSIHQLLNQVSLGGGGGGGSNSKPPSQNNSIHHPQSQSTHNRRDRRQSSGTENSKQQPSGTTAIEQSSRGMNNQNHPSTRTDHRSLNQHHPHSRRSSGGSSAHSRNGKSHIGLQNPTTATSTQSHQHTHPQHTSHPVNIVPAPVPIENANAEARHNILSLLGHPAAAAAAATRLDEVFATGTQNPTLVGLPAGNTMWPNPSPDSRGGSNPRNLYSPQQHPSKLSQQGSVPTSHQAYSSPRSHVASQEASPHHNSQHTSTSQRALPISSYGNSADRTPPRNAQISSANHSPNGPRPQLDSHHHHHHQQQSGANNLIPGVQSHSNGAPAAPGFSTSVWPFDNKMPNRALSPLNPARQSPSNMAHRGRGYPQPNHNGNNNRKSYQQQQQPSSRHLPIDHSPPLVNDSSRPSRSHSYTNETNNPANDHSHQRDHPHHHQRTSTATSTTNHSPSSGHPITVVNSKLAVESLDHLLIDQKLDGNRSQIGNLSVHDDQSENPLDKTHFVNSILDLINNNGAFVDTLYARYLARYAEKYL